MPNLFSNVLTVKGTESAVDEFVADTGLVSTTAFLEGRRRDEGMFTLHASSERDGGAVTYEFMTPRRPPFSWLANVEKHLEHLDLRFEMFSACWDLDVSTKMVREGGEQIDYASGLWGLHGRECNERDAARVIQTCGRTYFETLDERDAPMRFRTEIPYISGHEAIAISAASLSDSVLSMLEAMYKEEAASMARTNVRTALFHEELVARVWHPDGSMFAFFMEVDDEC